MPIEPDLDTRRYQELFDEALRRIPVHSPDWTNYNQSDPGMTLMQLFAWIADTLRYRLDSIPESHRAILHNFVAHLRRRRCAHVLIIGGSKRTRLALVQFIASKLGLSIYRVDPATVVSKYISETEKKLRQLFDAAHHERVILFLDEADALLMRPDSAIYPRGDFAQTHALTRLNC
jgi:SpoVK/Ycf46/Vps4 family AAA+-type ATPase